MKCVFVLVSALAVFTAVAGHSHPDEAFSEEFVAIKTEGELKNSHGEPVDHELADGIQERAGLIVAQLRGKKETKLLKQIVKDIENLKKEVKSIKENIKKELMDAINLIISKLDCVKCTQATTTISTTTSTTTTTEPADNLESKCGKVNRAVKIIGGVETEVHEYPWQVTLRTIVVGGSFLCGGSLINDRWVVTAAHCTQDGASHVVTLGNHHLVDTESAEIEVDVTRFINHPEYSGSGSEGYDISLLELETPLDLASVAPHISPVCLPDATNPSQYDDVEAIVSGWGLTSGGSVSNVLLEATIQTMSNSECKTIWGNYIRDSMICAQIDGKGSCKGDSGGPLVTEVDGYYNLIGVVSFGTRGCDTNVPGVYARVTHVIDWITSNTL